MTRFRVVTSFSPQGYELYGWVFLQAFRKYWTVPLTVYHEDDDEWFRAGAGASYNLMQDPECVEFLKHAPPDGKDYRYNADRFARKVFAITNPQNFDCDWLIWLDADTITQRKVTNRFLHSVCPNNVAGSYLGRTDWPHSECGFVGYSMRHGGRDFLAKFRETYTSGEIYNHLEWHDSYIYDRVRKEFPKMKFHNLSPDAKGLDAWNHSPLAEYMVHHKGTKAKIENYKGASV